MALNVGRDARYPSVSECYLKIGDGLTEAPDRGFVIALIGLKSPVSPFRRSL